MDARHLDMCAVAKVRCDPFSVSAFIGQIKLAPDRVREFRHHLVRPKAADVRAFGRGDVGQPHKKPQIRLD